MVSGGLKEGPLLLVLGVTMRDDIANVLVVYIATHIGRESRPHVLDLVKDCKIASPTGSLLSPP